MLYYVAAIVLIAFVFDFINGFHDSANSIATIVGTRVLSPLAAVVWAAFFNFTAAFTAGQLVAKAIQTGIIRTEIVTPNVILAGLLGAIVAFGQKRGGTFGMMILRQYGQWALILFIFGFFMPGVNNIAHAGGFVGGFLMGLALWLAERRAERGVDHLLAALCIGVTVLGFALNIWTTFVG